MLLSKKLIHIFLAELYLEQSFISAVILHTKLICSLCTTLLFITQIFSVYCVQL
jgi:hypothetical protein